MYQALYRKWRPRTFSDVVGQEPVTQTLRRQVAAGRLSHAYLFTGTRGTGKTTCAKLLARAVNCAHPAQGDPCNACPACRGIESGAILDVMELDAASNNRVDDIRAILDEAAYTPAAVNKRVYIIDEVHMLSAQAFNALLQILEEPPGHLLFILATTEVHKVPATIKSRCQQFAFKRIPAPQIARRLAWVAEQEGLDLSPQGAKLLARLADGGMRDALSLLDQCAGSGGSIGEAEVLNALGLAGQLESAALLESVARGDAASALERLDRLYAGGKDLSALLGELSALARDLLVARTAPGSADALMTGGCDAQTLDALGSLIPTPRLLRMAAALQRAAAGLARSPNRRIDAELCLVSLCDPALDDAPAGLAARVAALEARLAVGAAPPPPTARLPGAPPTPAAQGSPPASQISEHADEPPEEGPTYTDDPPPWAWEEEPQPRREPSPPVREAHQAAPPARETPPPRVEVPPASAPAGVSWAALRARLEEVMNVADFCFVGNPDMVDGSVEGQVVTLWAQSDFVKGFIDKPDILELVGQTAQALTGAPCRVLVRVGAAPVPPAGGDALDRLAGLENVTIT